MNYKENIIRMISDIQNVGTLEYLNRFIELFLEKWGRTVTTRRTVEYANGRRVREVSEPVVTEVEKYYPPDTTAQIFWLKNRKPGQWRDKREQDIDVTEAVKIVDSIGDSD